MRRVLDLPQRPGPPSQHALRLVVRCVRAKSGACVAAITCLHCNSEAARTRRTCIRQVACRASCCAAQLLSLCGDVAGASDAEDAGSTSVDKLFVAVPAFSCVLYAGVRQLGRGRQRPPRDFGKPPGSSGTGKQTHATIARHGTSSEKVALVCRLVISASTFAHAAITHALRMQPPPQECTCVLAPPSEPERFLCM